MTPVWRFASLARNSVTIMCEVHLIVKHMKHFYSDWEEVFAK